MCAESEERAHFVASSRNLSKLKSMIGNREGLLPPEEAFSYKPSEAEQSAMDGYMQGYVDGDPTQVKEKLRALSERYGTNDLGIVTNCYYFEDRVRSYELIAEVFGLSN